MPERIDINTAQRPYVRDTDKLVAGEIGLDPLPDRVEGRFVRYTVTDRTSGQTLGHIEVAPRAFTNRVFLSVVFEALHDLAEHAAPALRYQLSETAMTRFPDFTRAYIDAMYFTDTGETEQGQPPADAEISEELRARILEDCRGFWRLAEGVILSDACAGLFRGHGGPVEMAGHDFWLTRNDHGAGFWDGDWPEPAGQVLDQLARTFGPCEIYQGDDGRLYA